MNRQDWAKTMADAIYGENVMNDTMIVYNFGNEEFSYRSAMTPVGDDEVVVDANCHPDGFGNPTGDGYVITPGEFAAILAEEGNIYDEYWRETVSIIEYQKDTKNF